MNEALERMENSTRQLRGYHFKSILGHADWLPRIAGGCFALGWSKLSRHYELKVKAALERVVSVNATNEETFTQLTKMNVPIRVVPVVDNRKQTIPRKFVGGGSRGTSASRICAMESERPFTSSSLPIDTVQAFPPRADRKERMCCPSDTFDRALPRRAMHVIMLDTIYIPLSFLYGVKIQEATPEAHYLGLAC